MTTKKHFLHGEWMFSFTDPNTGAPVQDRATVPGNVEPELVRIGLLTDYMPPDHRRATTQFEIVDDWTYVKHFDAPPLADGYERDLVFEGIDTVAEIYLNGEKLADCANMHREWRFSVGTKLKKTDNELKVIIRSAELWARDHMPDVFPILRAGSQYGSAIYLRKARHSWGWDNAPRLLTSGIFRPVYLEDRPVERFDNVYYYTKQIDDAHGKVSLGLNWFYHFPRTRTTLGYTFHLTLSSQNEVLYTTEEEVFSPRGACHFSLPLDRVKLWWPVGFGDAHQYDLCLQMRRDGEPVAEWNGKWGIRTVRLIQSEFLTEDDQGDFVFVVNNRRVMIRGTNWKPTDPLHSRADAKVLKFLPLAKELHCNMIRIWGGGIYEDHPFFDYCDENGILVWHDFMFACEITPRDKWFCDEVEKEATFILRKLRNHPSIALWCGDNENDVGFLSLHRGSIALPSDQIVTREVLRDAVLRNDPYRDYVESSPKQPDECAIERRMEQILRYEQIKQTDPKNLPPKHYPLEAHVYPSTSYSVALRQNRARFIGETGPITYNQMSDREELWEREKERAIRLWDADHKSGKFAACDSHQHDYYFARWISCGRAACRETYGRDFTPDEWKDYSMAINLIGADIFKDAIEYTRVMRWTKTGVLWWSLSDMWPMLFNYSMVDCDGNRKLPFDWIRQSQRAFALMAVRTELSHPATLYATNDTLSEQNGSYRITAYDERGNAAPFATGTFHAAANSANVIAQIPDTDSRLLLLIEWTVNGETHCNHFVTGSAPYPFETWQKWNAILKENFQNDRM